MLKNPQFFRNNIKKIRYLLSKLFPDQWDTLYIIQVSPPLTRFSNNMVFSIARFVLVLSFVHSLLSHSSTYTVFCFHSCFSNISKSSVSRGSPVIHNRSHGIAHVTFVLLSVWPNTDRGNTFSAVMSVTYARPN